MTSAPIPDPSIPVPHASMLEGLLVLCHCGTGSVITGGRIKGGRVSPSQAEYRIKDTHTRTHTHTHTHICTHTRMHAHMHTHTHAHAHTYTRTTHTHTHTHTRSHTHTHAHTHILCRTRIPTMVAIRVVGGKTFFLIWQ
eukprot:GHVU01138086.1.p2 GENE.GHVU01138086.1~~GHVU01138086.1.p2  ORF type:complete len:139 (-),score=1.24 GHVU01138086.1:14-430(-)